MIHRSHLCVLPSSIGRTYVEGCGSASSDTMVAMIQRTWAFWRRVQYGGFFTLLLCLMVYGFYNTYLYSAPTCFDGSMNGVERGVDCGGGCLLICANDVASPTVDWARSFRVTESTYNAVAYVENRNATAGAPVLSYTFSLYDDDGLITERTGTTFLPPNSTYPVFEGRIQTGNRVPTQTFLELNPVSVWLPVPAGREQFRIVSRELLAADTRPRLNATLENTTLEQSDNVEIIATIFDANGNALTASRTIVESIMPRSQSNLIFTWPEPIAKTLRSCEIPTDVVIAIDLSGSMNNDQDTPPEPISSVLVAAEQFAERLNTRDQAALVTFASDGLVVSPFSTPGGVASDIALLTIDPSEETGSTNTGEAFLRASEVFASEGKNPDARKVMVVLTDGLATAPDEEPEEYARAEAARLKASGVEVYAIGLGEAVNMEFVRELASEGQAFQALSRSQVDTIYRDITGAICEDGAAIIDIVPKTNANFPEWR